MALDLIEGAVYALYNYFLTNIAAALDTVDAHHADSIILEDIKTWYLGNAPTAMPEWPCLWFEALSFTPKRAHDKGVVTIDPYRIDIVVLIGCADEQERFRRLDRYAEAIMNLVEATASVASFNYDYQWAGDVKKSPEFNNGEWIQAISIPIALSANENY